MKVVAPLTVKQVAAISKEGRTAVGGVRGLYLFIRGNSRLYVYRFKSPETGKMTTTSVGPAADISLSEARARARVLWMKVSEGVDPILEERRKKAERVNQKAENARLGKTFSEAFDEWLENRLRTGYYSDPDSAEYKIRNLMKNHVAPHIGGMAVCTITPQALFEVVKPLWMSSQGTRRKVQAILNGVFRWSMACGYCQTNSADMRGPLGALLENVGRPAGAGSNLGALHYEKVPDLIRRLASKENSAARALIFSILTASRSKPVRLARWYQVDLEKKVWIVPESSMKAKGRGDFVVYLSDAAVDFLRSLPCVKKEDFIFPTIHGSALSDMAMNMQLRRLNAESASRGEEVLRDEEQSRRLGKDVQITQHGTSRASFKTWTKSDGNARRFNADAVELCLAHKIDHRFHGAYDRAKMEEERREVMQAWGEFCFSRLDPEMFHGV